MDHPRITLHLAVYWTVGDEGEPVSSQAKNKLHNRKTEFLLHDIEFLSAVAQAVQTAEGHGTIHTLLLLLLLARFGPVGSPPPP
jgi:hypothetical protein